MRVGLDIGGTKTHAVLLDADGQVLAEARRPTGWGGEQVLATAHELTTEVLLAGGVAPAALELVGVGIPGAVDHATGRVRQALNLGLAELDLAGALHASLGAPVHVENDVNAAALGVAARRGDGASLAYLNLGTGLAAGLVLDGTIWRGARGAAGEIGHVPFDPAGPVCPCGQRGCLELMASGSGIAAQWRAERDGDVPKVRHLPALAATDPLAGKILHRLHTAVAAAIRLIVLSVDVEVVVIGGGLARLGPELLVNVLTVLRTWEDSSPFLASLAPSARVELLRSTGPVAAVGAALGGRLPERVAG